MARLPVIRVLVIDDDEEDFIITSDLLRSHSSGRIVLEWAPTFSAGLTALEADTHDVYLVDYRLGAEDGLDLVVAARHLDQRWRPLIVLTGQADPETDDRALALGADDFLSKTSLNGAMLDRAIRYVLGRARVVEQLRTSEATQRRLFRNSPLPMWIFDRGTLRFLDVNEAAIQAYGYSRAEFREMTVRDLRPPEEIERLNSLLPGIEDNGFHRSGLWKHRKKSGEIIQVEITSHNTEYMGQPGRLAVAIDCTERLLAEARAMLMQRAIEAANNGIIIADAVQPDFPLIYVNPAFERMTGYSSAEVLGRNCRFLQGADTDQPGLEEIRKSLAERGAGRATLHNYRRDGSMFWNDLHLAPVRDADGQVTHFVGVLNDITQQKNYESELAWQASHDTLTGLPNRALLVDRLRQAVRLAQRTGNSVAVLFIDLDNFKLVNDSLGHQAGDELLRRIASRLVESVAPEYTVARFGGDEFVVIGPELENESAAEDLARNIQEILRPVFTFEDQTLYTSVSIGIALFPRDGAEIERLLQYADLAMYRAKEHGRNSVEFYAPELNSQIADRLTTIGRLHQALERGEFLLHYQPKVCYPGCDIVGLEALIRWQHPERGLILPGEFIGLAEQSGLIVQLGQWVLREACRQMRAWTDAGIRLVPLAVNVSTAQFRQDGLAELVTKTLAQSGLPPAMLELEITESLIMDGAQSFIERLHALTRLGVCISIDDFGTGYSSLAYLKRLPIRRLKIDRSFVNDITTDPNDASICRAIISMARDLGIESIAEGVETAEQAAFLHRHGCVNMQGWLFSRAVCAADAVVLLKAGRIDMAGP